MVKDCKEASVSTRRLVLAFDLCNKLPDWSTSLLHDASSLVTGKAEVDVIEEQVHDREVNSFRQFFLFNTGT